VLAISSSSRILSFGEMKRVGLEIVQVSFILVLEGFVMRTGRAGKDISWERGKQAEHLRLPDIFDQIIGFGPR
jgi:hypothetical protein